MSTNALRASLSLVALGLVCLMVGCRTVPRTRVESQFASLPQASRDQVQIYLVGSPLDSFDIAGLPAMRRRMNELGFENTEHVNWTTPKGLAKRVASDHQQNPSGQIVLVGWSLGCLQVLDAASELEKQQVQVARVICLDGNPWVGIQGIRRRYPTLSERVVCVYPKHRDLPSGLAKTRQRQVGAWQHFGVPLHEETIETIFTELVTVVREDTLAAESGHQLAVDNGAQEQAPLPEPGPLPAQVVAYGPTLKAPAEGTNAGTQRFATEAIPARQMTAIVNRNAQLSSAQTTLPSR